MYIFKIDVVDINPTKLALLEAVRGWQLCTTPNSPRREASWHNIITLV